MGIKKKKSLAPKPNENVYKLIEYIRKIDFNKEYNEIKEWLSLRPDTPAQLRDMLYDCESLANRAQVLVQHVKLERKKYELECNERLEILRSVALDFLESDKKEKDLKKQITNQMIEDRVLATEGSLYIDIIHKQNEMKSIEALIEDLATQIKNKEINMRKIFERENIRTPPQWMNKKR